jgi:hypothetical protein
MFENSSHPSSSITIRAVETKPTLKQPSFVDDIHAGLNLAVGCFVFSREDEKRDRRSIEHLGDARILFLPHGQGIWGRSFTPQEVAAFVAE